MPRLNLILLLLVSCLVTGAAPVWAQKSSILFTAKGVRVDVTGETAVNAKNRAFATGGRIALGVVVKRLAISGNLPKLKRSEIEDLIKNYQVETEKSSATRYIGSLSYELDADAVRALMAKHGVVFSEARSQPVLVLPVWQTTDGLGLFRGSNPWKQAWDQSNLDEGSLLPMIAALGDLQDATMISPEAAKAADTEKLKAIADKYETGKVMVAVARQKGEQSIKLTAKVFDGSGKSVDTVSLSVSGAGQAGALANAVGRLHANLLGRWKNRTAIVASKDDGGVGNQGPLRAVFRLQNFSQWLKMQKAIESSFAVKSYKVLGLSKSRAVLSITHVGNIQNLRVGLKQQNVLLKKDDANEYWWLYFRGGVKPPVTKKQ